MISDAHIHASALPANAGDCAFAVTCTPTEFLVVEGCGTRVALGLHPWWITDENAVQLADEFCETAKSQRFIGEVGLDFYKQYAQFSCMQLNVVHRVLSAVEDGDRIISFHSRGADMELLDILEEHGTHRASTCILHGFAGSSQAMARAVEMGLLFSLGPRQMASKRGREYARQLPANRLLLETDFDNAEPVSLDEWQRVLQDTLAQLNETRVGDMTDIIQGNFDRIFSRL